MEIYGKLYNNIGKYRTILKYVKRDRNIYRKTWKHLETYRAYRNIWTCMETYRRIYKHIENIENYGTM